MHPSFYFVRDFKISWFQPGKSQLWKVLKGLKKVENAAFLSFWILSFYTTLEHKRLENGISMCADRDFNLQHFVSHQNTIQRVEQFDPAEISQLLFGCNETLYRHVRPSVKDTPWLGWSPDYSSCATTSLKLSCFQWLHLYAHQFSGFVFRMWQYSEFVTAKNSFAYS